MSTRTGDTKEGKARDSAEEVQEDLKGGGTMRKFYTVYDVKAEAYLDPVLEVNAAVALRRFAEAANTDESNFHRHASDYTLFETGTWDDTKGRGDWHETRVPLGCAIEFIKPKENG